MACSSRTYSRGGAGLQKAALVALHRWHLGTSCSDSMGTCPLRKTGDSRLVSGCVSAGDHSASATSVAAGSLQKHIVGHAKFIFHLGAFRT